MLWHRKSEEDDEVQLPILVLDWSGATSEMLLGRGTECDLLIPDRSVSRRHAQLFFRDGKWILVDLDSKNGTYINGVQVQRAELLPGDVVALGIECLRVD
jgi:predicted component of type VI protein secretion system